MSDEKFDLKRSEKLKKKHGGHGWLSADDKFYPCDSESCITHVDGGLWGHERAAVNLLERYYPDLLNELETEIEKAGYESFDDTNGNNVVREFMVKKGFTEV